MKVNQYLLPSFTVFALLATILIAQWTGQWITSGKELIDVNNLTTTDEIRGWMTLQQVADGFDLTLPALYTLLQLPPDLPTETALKDLEGIIPDFEVTTVREALARQGEDAMPGAQPTSTPIALPTPTRQPTLNAEGEMIRETAVAASTPSHTDQDEGAGTGPTPLPPGEILTGANVKGSHTLQAIVDQAQVSLEQLLAALNLPADTDPNLAVRELIEQGEIGEIEEVRNVVTTLQAE